MKQRFSSYPIGKLLLDVIDGSGLSVHDFFAELGIRNFTKSFARLDSWLEHGEGNYLFIERIQSSRFAIDEHRLAAVMAENDVLLQRDRERAKDKVRPGFRPYAEVIPELSHPTSANAKVFALTGGNRACNIPLPDSISTWSREDQLTYLKKVIPQAFSNRHGTTRFTGKIIGYLYRPTFDDKPLRFTTDGDIDTVNIDARSCYVQSKAELYDDYLKWIHNACLEGTYRSLVMAHHEDK